MRAKLTIDRMMSHSMYQLQLQNAIARTRGFMMNTLAVRLLVFAFALMSWTITVKASTAHREALERFELRTLQFYSSSEKAGCGWQLSVIDPDGYVHYVRVGNYVGKHKGQIKRISHNTVWIDEVVPDSKGELNNKMTAVPVSKRLKTSD